MKELKGWQKYVKTTKKDFRNLFGKKALLDMDSTIKDLRYIKHKKNRYIWICT